MINTARLQETRGTGGHHNYRRSQNNAEPRGAIYFISLHIYISPPPTFFYWRYDI